MAALPSPAPGRSPGRAIAAMAATWARRLKADLTSSQPTKDDHRGNQTKQNGNRDAIELACGCGVSPPCSRPRCPGGLVLLTAGEGCRGGHCSSLSPRLGRWPHGGDEQMFGAKQQV